MDAPDAGEALATMEMLAGVAGPLIHQQLGASAVTKADGTPVTELDIALNRLVIDFIAERHPGVPVLGEEASSLDGNDGGYEEGGLFIVDPIDGTAAFTAGIGLAAFVCAYAVDGLLQAAVVEDPFAGARFAARVGCGATLNGKPIHVGEQPRSVAVQTEGLRGTRWAASSLELNLREAGFIPTRLMAFVGPACRVATGAVSGAAFLRASPWDTSALALIVAEAGGVVTTIEGASTNGRVPEDGILVAHPTCHQAILEVLRAS